MQPAFPRQRAQGERPDHAVFTPGDETRSCGADDWPAGTHSWLVNVIAVSEYIFICLYAISIIRCLLSSSSGPSPLKGQATPNTKPQPHQTVSKKKAEALQFISNKCPECQAQFSSKEEVAEHFQEIKPAQTSVSLLSGRKKRTYINCVDQWYESELTPFVGLSSSVVLQPCTECSPPMLLPNSCSAAAHQRIHQGCPPHVCPDCGGTAKQPLFQTHLDQICLHFARRIGYRCDIIVIPINSVSFLCHCLGPFTM